MKKIIVFGCVIFIFFYVFNVYENSETVSDVYDVSGVYVYKPKVKIIDESSNSRVYAVSINNNHNSWPHAGLQEAYLVYELIAEGGITRILAFYKDVNLEKIGSVRSARNYFLDYVLENDAIFVHYGHSPQALSDIKEYGVDNINGINNSGAFFRDKTINKAFEHTAFTSTKLINQYIDKFNYRKTSSVNLLKYSPYEISYENDKTLTNAEEVVIKYSNYTNTKYVYDKENKNYIQYMSDVLQKDAVSNKEYRVKNIITYKVENKLIDSKGRQDLKNVGSGEGYYISNGNAIKIKWEKKSRKDRTVYYDSYGKELVLNDGNTWIHIEPKNESLIIN